MKRYLIKDEFKPEWGDTVQDTSEPVNENEINRLAAAWGVPVDELMKELDEIEE